VARNSIEVPDRQLGSGDTPCRELLENNPWRHRLLRSRVTCVCPDVVVRGRAKLQGDR
jgi:hypothetical protein